MLSFDAPTADAAWLLAAAALKERSLLPKQNGRGGSTTELLHVTIQIHNPRQRWVISREPALSVAFAIVEVIGILNGRRDARYLNFFNPIVPRFAGSGTEYHGAYGHRLRVQAGFDQLQRASDALTANPDGRQVVFQIWDAGIDFPLHDGTPVAEDIPCNICSMLKVRDGKLEWSQIMRSNDLFRGLPYNIVQFTTLQEVIAGWIGAEPGTYTHFADSLHVYDDNARDAFESSGIQFPESTDSLALPKNIADPIWGEMNRRIDILVSKDLSPQEYRAIARIDNAPQSFSNLMAVVAADAARRKGCVDGVRDALSECRSAVLQKLWDRWQARRASVNHFRDAT
jgi:thymidylate synthase